MIWTNEKSYTNNDSINLIEIRYHSVLWIDKAKGDLHLVGLSASWEYFTMATLPQTIDSGGGWEEED